jgi:hypothetical protein
MKLINNKLVAYLKHEYNGWPAGSRLVVEETSSGFYRAWTSFNKAIGTDIGIVPKQYLL